MEGKVELGYWGIRGLGQVPRLLLAYTKTPFEDTHYTSPEQYAAWKEKSGFDFPNLPYLVDGDFKLSESSAINNYICRRAKREDLLGKCHKDRAYVNRLMGVLTDASKEIRGLIWDKDHEAHKADVLKKAEGKLKELQHHLGGHCHEFALSYLTIVDFQISEFSYYFETLFPNEFKNTYTFMGKIRRNFNKLPEIKEYYASEKSVKGPFMPKGRAAVDVVCHPDVAEEPKHEVVLGYWGIRGLGQVSRLLLAQCGVNFHDKTYSSKEAWFDGDKIGLGLHFPNLPYLITPEIRLTESSAINVYICEKYQPELLGKNCKDHAVIEELIGVWKDGITDIQGLFFNPKYEEVKAAALTKATPKFNSLQKFIGDKPNALGYLTLADFIIAESSHWIQKVFPEEYKAWTFFHNIRATVEALPGVKAYYAKEGSIKAPFVPPIAAISF